MTRIGFSGQPAAEAAGHTSAGSSASVAAALNLNIVFMPHSSSPATQGHDAW
jgi:hypothetical protein